MINLDGLEGFDNLDDIKNEIQRRANAHNHGALDDFDGLSPEEMHELQRNFLKKNSPLVLNKLSEDKLKKCPLLMQVRLLIDKMRGGKEIKLTKTGALPTQLVKEIYDLGYLKNESVELGITKLSKESDAMEISITRILLEISSLVKKRNGKISLTKGGEKYADNGNFILEEILTVLLLKFNWAYFDGHESETIGRINPAFSLFLLKKYGDKKRFSVFYAEKYFKAFPQLLEDGERSFRCYALRSFERYFKFMGFVHVEKPKFLSPAEIKKTVFFDELFSVNSSVRTIQ